MRMSDMTVCPVASRQSFFDSFTVVTKAIGQLEKLMSGKVLPTVLIAAARLYKDSSAETAVRF